MTDEKGAGIPLKEFAFLHQMTTEAMLAVLNAPIPYAIDRSKGCFEFADALEFEIARQLSDNSGIPMGEALRLSMYTMAVKTYVRRKANGAPVQDFWMAVTGSRNTWGDSRRGSVPVTSFGPKEYWSELHFTGSLGEITGEISEWIGRDQVNYPDSDPARIIMCNVSTAERRLRKRAAELGIDLGC